MLLDLIRKLVPIRYRQSLGLWTAHQASRSKLLLYPYMWLLCRAIPNKLMLLPDDKATVDYKGFRILTPRDSIFTSWEVLQDEVYEKVAGPVFGNTVIDIGAHIGLFTVKAALQVGKYGKVVAIEPSPNNLEYLRANTEEQLDNVIIAPVAAGSSKHDGYLTVSGASPCCSLSSGQGACTELVKVDTLDNILHDASISKVDFIKIDAEGAELDILEGAMGTLRNNKLRVVVASYHNLPNGAYELPFVQQFFLNLGFRVITIKEYVYADNLEAE